MTYRVFVKRSGCLGETCRRCHDFVPGLHDDHGGVFMFSHTSLMDRERNRIILNLIACCPAGVLGWEKMGKQ